METWKCWNPKKEKDEYMLSLSNTLSLTSDANEALGKSWETIIWSGGGGSIQSRLIAGPYQVEEPSQI